VVYAVNAVEPHPDSNLEEKLKMLGTAECHPVFSGQLEPDVAFFGFELNPDSVRGSDTDPGWFFVLQEQPSEPDFGLDAADGPMGQQKVECWDKLSWGHLAGTPEDWDKLAYIDLDTALPDTAKADLTVNNVAWHVKVGQGGTTANAAALAYITLQKPVRVAIHGSDMLQAK
jgi:hypothetical protein